MGTLIDSVLGRDPNCKHSLDFGLSLRPLWKEVDVSMNSRPQKKDGRAVGPKRAVSRRDSRGQALI